MIAALLAIALSDGFRVYQYTPKAVVVRGCAECAGEPDETCQIPAGVQTRGLSEYARGRWPAQGRLKLLVSSADPDCAVPEQKPRGTLELAAIHLGEAAPTDSLFASAGKGVRGWPRAPNHRTPEEVPVAEARRASLRPAMVCWPAKSGWPSPRGEGKDARAGLDPANSCEPWLLAVTAAGAPDPGGASFRAGPATAFGDARFLRAMQSLVPAAPPRAEAPPRLEEKKKAGCPEAAAARPAVVERFLQWERSIRGAGASSLDRHAFSLDAVAWAGHCQELEVLHAALERQLGCAVAQEGRCPTAP